MHRARSAAAGSNSELSPKDVGVRVSILFSIDDPEYPFSEAAGVVERIHESDDGPVYSIRKRNGTLIEVPASQIIRLKRLPSR